MKYKDAATYFIQIYLSFLFKNVQIRAETTERFSTTTKEPESEIVTRVAPPKIYPFPGITFEGIEYEDQRHIKHRYPHLPHDSYYSRKESWRCWYEQLRCIRYQSNARPVCTSDTYRMMYSFISICEMEYYNCVLEYTARFFYSGDERECWYIMDNHIWNEDNEWYQEQYGLPADHSDTWGNHRIHLPHPYWSE